MNKYVYKLIVLAVRAEFQQYHKEFDSAVKLEDTKKAAKAFIRMQRWHNVHCALIEARYGVIPNN